MNAAPISCCIVVVSGCTVAALPLIYRWHIALRILNAIQAQGEGNARLDMIPLEYQWAMFVLGAVIALWGMKALFRSRQE